MRRDEVYRMLVCFRRGCFVYSDTAAARSAGRDPMFACGTCLIRYHLRNAILMRLKGNDFILKGDIVFCRDLRKHATRPSLVRYDLPTILCLHFGRL